MTTPTTRITPEGLPATLTVQAPITAIILHLHTLTTPPVEWQRAGESGWREEIDRTRAIDAEEVVQFRLRWEFYAILFSLDTARLHGTLQQGRSEDETHLRFTSVEYPGGFLYLTGTAIAVAALTGVVALSRGDFGNVVLALAPMLLLGLAAWGVRQGAQAAVRSRLQRVQLDALEVEQDHTSSARPEQETEPNP
jgi:hypothetical protein